MNIKISDNWLREYIETPATVDEMAKSLSLCSVGVERIERINGDTIYDIEVTTNRPDLMSIIGIAREASAVLPQFGIDATFKPLKVLPISSKGEDITKLITIKSEKDLVHRILAVVMEVTVKKSPEQIKNRLETTDIRSLNSVIDVTNYVMREIGHPAHVFDFDRLTSKKILIRKSKPGETLTTLDKKEYVLPGNDIVADNGNGELVDLIGIMGTENSVVTENTKRILFFLDNNNPDLIRKTSMKLGIRTEAAVLNEKGVDPELMYQSFARGIQLYKEIADATIISTVLDIYPNPPKPVTVTANTNTIRSVIGIEIPDAQIKKMLTSLGFTVNIKGAVLTVQVPSFRIRDIAIEEDIIEEVARVYGYHNLPSVLPPQSTVKPYQQSHDPFYWERKVKTLLQHWGFTEVYTYSMVSEKMIEKSPENFLKIKNPLDSDHEYMRQSLIPSLLEVVEKNTTHDENKLFEIANVYISKKNSIPDEIPYFSGIVKGKTVSFYTVKGYISQLLTDLGIHNFKFSPSISTEGADVFVDKEKIGTIELLDTNFINFEFNFNTILKYVSLIKQYRPISNHPPIIEDVTIEFSVEPIYAEVIAAIYSTSGLIKEVTLTGTYHNRKTFRISYQHSGRTLTNEEVSEIRKKIYDVVAKKLNAKVI
jgi:phenylalanyl-tRNA synthetase beta chain